MIDQPLADEVFVGEADDQTVATIDDETTDWWPAALPVPWRHPLAAIGWAVQMAAGTAAIGLLLAIVAAIPVANFYALGVLLDVGACASRGRLRAAFWLWGAAPRLGTILLATWLTLLPVRLLSSMATSAAIIDPAAETSVALRIGTMVAAVVAAMHLLLAVARGGRVRHFLWPIGNLWWLLRGGAGADWYRRSSYELAALLRWLQLPRLWWLGVRGFAGALAWLVVPTALYLAARREDDPRIAITLLAFFPLVHVFCRLPILQMHFAREGRLKAYLAHRQARWTFGYAPWEWTLAIVLLYALTLPLYLTKIVLPPRDVVWLATIFFVVTIFPTKLLLGWAYGRSERRRAAGLPRRRWWVRWPARVVMVAGVGAYAFLLFFTQFISEHGRAALFEQHAFLLPWPL